MSSSADSASPLARVGVVVIGRNEGPRLAACLAAIPRSAAAIVYADSGSTDDSVAIATRAGVEVVPLDDSRPFTASRGRNAGFAAACARADIDYVQFVDGDCALVPGWLETAAGTLDARPDVFAVAGRLHELHPEASVYNRLCEMEWAATPPGEARAFGGIVMIRAKSLRAVGGWDETVIAAEDDELALRLRASGGKVLRLADTMAHHDASMTRFGQWWRRSVRCGHAYAQVADLHGAGEERTFRHETRRAWIWGLGIPTAAALLFVPSLGTSGLLLGLYPFQAARLARRCRESGRPAGDAAAWGVGCVLARFAEVQGMVKYRLAKLRGRPTRIIEYKGPGDAPR